MLTLTSPLPLDTCLIRIEAYDGTVHGFWRTHVIHRPKDGFSRIGIRQVPTYGIPYHLVLLRAELHALPDNTTHITARQKVNEWVWFATLPLAALLMYSLGLLIEGDLIVNWYSVGMMLALAGYVVMMAALVISHSRRNRAILATLLYHSHLISLP